MARIPTELYICVPRRSNKGAFFANAWVNLTRKDTGEGVRGKWVLSYLGDVNLSRLYTGGTGYAGPFDFNPKTEGDHKFHVAFEGDAEFEPCKSEEIILKVDPNLETWLKINMGVTTPVSGDAPLTIHVRGLAVLYGNVDYPPEHPLPLDLMVNDGKSTKRLQPVKNVMSKPDGVFSFDYTFTKPGTYRIFVNFLGDDKYASVWSNGGQTTLINVLEGGELPLTFEKNIPEVVAAKVPRNYKFILAATVPDTPDGYERAAEWDMDFGILGKYWAFRKKGAA